MSNDPQSPELATIDLTELDGVTGGVTQAAAAPPQVAVGQVTPDGWTRVS